MCVGHRGSILHIPAADGGPGVIQRGARGAQGRLSSARSRVFEFAQRILSLTTHSCKLCSVLLVDFACEVRRVRIALREWRWLAIMVKGGVHAYI